MPGPALAVAGQDRVHAVLCDRETCIPPHLSWVPSKEVNGMKIQRRCAHLVLISTFVLSTLGLASFAGASRQSAVRVVKRHGYNPVNKRQYKHAHKLRLLIGRKVFGCCAVGRKAFFFVRKRGFERTDVRRPSGTGLRVAWQQNRTVALRYGPLYRKGDASCCPSGGTRTVRFRWNGVAVKVLDPIPSPKKRRALS